MLCLVVSDSLWSHGLNSPPDSSVHGDSPGKSIRVSCHALLQGIFPTLGLNPGFSHFRWTLYCLSHQDMGRDLHAESSWWREACTLSSCVSGEPSNWPDLTAKWAVGWVLLRCLCNLACGVILLFRGCLSLNLCAMNSSFSTACLLLKWGSSAF